MWQTYFTEERTYRQTKGSKKQMNSFNPYSIGVKHSLIVFLEWRVIFIMSLLWPPYWSKGIVKFWMKSLGFYRNHGSIKQGYLSYYGASTGTFPKFCVAWSICPPPPSLILLGFIFLSVREKELECEKERTG